MSSLSQHWTALITSLTILLQFAVAFNVGRARKKYKIDAPSTTGHIDFERSYRVQMNTLESTIAFLPALWLFSLYQNPTGAAILGGIWLIGRILYAISYQQDAKKRGPGFGVSFLASIILTFGGLWGTVQALITKV